MNASDFSFKAFIGNETPKLLLPTHTAIDGKMLYVCSSGSRCIFQYTLHDNLYKPVECNRFGNEHLYQITKKCSKENHYQPLEWQLEKAYCVSLITLKLILSCLLLMVNM